MHQAKYNDDQYLRLETQKLNGEFHEGASHESGIEALLRHKGMEVLQPDNLIGYFLIMSVLCS